jgi:hypothetical protein
MELAKDIAKNYQLYIVVSCVILTIGSIIKPKDESNELGEIIRGILYSYLVLIGWASGILGMMGFFAAIVKFAIK